MILENNLHLHKYNCVVIDKKEVNLVTFLEFAEQVKVQSICLFN